MSDTVGFVRHLPHQLVEAFRSTLEEVADSDLILHVVDGSHPDPGVSSPRSARCSPRSAQPTSPSWSSSTRPMPPTRWWSPGCASASPTRSSSPRAPARASPRRCASSRASCPPGRRVQALLPYRRGDLINRLHQQGEITSMEHTGEGTVVVGRANGTSPASSRRTPSEPRRRP